MKTTGHRRTGRAKQFAMMAAGIVVATVISAQTQQPLTPAPVRLRATTVPNGFTLAAVGDLLLEQPIPPNIDPAVAEILRGADVTMGNLETTIIDMRHFKGYATAQSHAMTAPPQVAKDLKALGFDLLARANNHAADWGTEGIVETERHLTEVGLIYAGSGLSRSEARVPRYFTTASKRRVAFVSLASSFSNRVRSSDPIGEVPGTPGINGLRTRRFSIVTPQMMQGLRAMAKAYDDAGVSTAGTFNNTLLSGADWDYRPKSNELLLFGTYFREGDKPGLDYDMNETDVREILANIREGKARSDFLVVTMHAHESPAPFVQTIARAAIDNGADAFVGHGVFHPLGIEVYKGKPIYYGLSDFINQRALTGPIPLDEYERYGVPITATPTEFRAAWNARSFRDKEVYRAIIAVGRYDQGQLAELRLYPVDTYSDRPAALGIPHLPTPALAREILEKIQQLSAPYGTNIRIENNVGVITVSSTP